MEYGYDGLIYSLGFLVGWPIILFLIVLLVTLFQFKNESKYTND